MTGKAMFFCLMMVLLASCSNGTSVPTAKPTEIQKTPTVSPSVTIDSYIPTIVPSHTGTPDPKINIIATPGPYEQVYTDPEGWYLVNFPDVMEHGDKPNVFWSYGHTLETGYLPELGYVSRAMLVCAWLANTELDPAKTTMMGDFLSTSCSVSSKPYDDYSIDYFIYENPGADAAHRFVYIKTTHYTFSYYFDVTFSWTRSVPKTRSEPGFAPLSQDDVSFWKNAAPMPSEVSVTEYKLLPNAPSPYEDQLFDYIPKQARPTPRSPIGDMAIPSPTPEKDPLEELGYQTKTIQADASKTCPLCTRQIYRNGKLLFDHVLDISNIYRFSTKNGPINAFFVESAGNIFLVQNDVVSLWYHNDHTGFSTASGIYKTYFSSPILYQDELLWVSLSGNFPSGGQVHKSNQQVVFSFVRYNDYPQTNIARITKVYTDLLSWHDHWILTFGDFLVEDGEMVNKKLGFQQIFGWNLIHDKPVYFFRKGPRLGISYNDQILPLQYEDISYEPVCCSNSPKTMDGIIRNGPEVSGDSARFYGRRNGVWYYVVMKFK